MGLTLKSKNKVWCSNYSGVQVVRELMIIRCLEYIKNLKYGEMTTNVKYSKYNMKCPYEIELQKEKESQSIENFDVLKSELILFLESLLCKKEVEQLPWGDVSYLNYEPWKKTIYALYYFGLGGLRDFVNHSDCDGYFTTGQCLNILEMGCRIYSDDDLDEIFELIEDSYVNQSYVIFS